MNKKYFFIVVSVLLLVSFSCVAFAAGDGIISSIFGGLSDIANFIKRIFVPDKDYFHNQLAIISKMTNDRLGGIAYLYNMLNEFFQELRNTPAAGLSFKLPNSFFFKGYKGFSFDFFASAAPYINFIRNVTTSAFCLFIAVACYHKIRTFFSEN